MPTPPTIEDIRAAAERLKPYCLRTPLLESPHLNAIAGARVLIKPEPLQRTGSFKFRGAFNTISQLGPEAKTGGVVAYSSGNHAQGVAAAAQILGLPAVIVMPEDAPAIKIANTKSYGAEVITYHRLNDDRAALSNKICEERGATLIRPYDDPRIIAGQGTLGLEVAEQTKADGIQLDYVVAPAGGGGLISGTALALRSELPQTRVYSAEPEGFDDTARSLESGTHQENDMESRSICDALLAPTPGDLTFSMNKELLEGGLVVSDDEAKEAMRQAFLRLKLVVEPGGAVALAAVLSGKLDCQGKTVCVVCSGGNVDPQMFAEILLS